MSGGVAHQLGHRLLKADTCISVSPGLSGGGTPHPGATFCFQA